MQTRIPKEHESDTPRAPAEMPAEVAGSFKARLYYLRRQRGWTQSELARRVWGSVEDARGYSVAKHRDRISIYEHGSATPRRESLDAIAKALGVTVSELAPDLVAASRGGPAIPGSVSLVGLPGGQARLTVDAVVSFEVALQVARLLGGAPSEPS
jgi:transcriptional regulator with XRE-family HTH domain